MPDIPAKSVAVVKYWRAACLLPGCGWEGSDADSYQAANTERIEHLEAHRV